MNRIHFDPPASTFKQRLGCWLHERPQTELALFVPRLVNWLDLCNRNEAIATDDDSGGRVCHWRDSSQLTVSRIFPGVGTRLLHHCLKQWPLTFNFDRIKATTEQPEASILLVIGGTDRIEQFRLVLASLRGQTHRSMEIIVVEQSETPEIEHELPSDVRYFHTYQPAEVGFNKSWALNVAAREARGHCLLIHDADYVVPSDYVNECCRVLKTVDGVRPSRFNFHLERESTFELINMRTLPRSPILEYIIQNNPTPMAVRRDVYWEIGGHDESFVGWGGEDVEFLARLRTKNMAEGGWLPTIHLWHPAAPQKASGHRNQQQQIDKLSSDPAHRIEALRARSLGGSEPVLDSEILSR